MDPQPQLSPEALLQSLRGRFEELCHRVDIFRDDGYSGAMLSRPGLDRLRDRAALATFDRVYVTDPIDWPAASSTRSC